MNIDITWISDQLKLNISEINALVGYDCKNFKLRSVEGEEYVLKVYDASVNIQSLKSEDQLLNGLSHVEFIALPKVIMGSSPVELDGNKYIIRALSFVPGSFWKDQKITNHHFEDLGKTTAKFHQELQKIEPHNLCMKKSVWDLQYLYLNGPAVKYLSPTDQRLVEYFLDQHETFVRPKIDSLRMCVIQGDINDWNILANEEKITGLIDFGDCCYSQMVNDLAIAIAYALMYTDEYVETCKSIIGAYHKVLPLSKDELSVLYYLIAGRWITTVTQAALSRINQPDNKYTSVSEEYAWPLLRNWIKLSPTLFSKEMYQICGFPIHNNKPRKSTILENRKKYFSSALSVSYDEPIFMESSAFQYMYDFDGNTILDAYNNIPLVGHAHPRITKVISEQSKKLNTNTRYHYDLLGEYAEKLISKFPPKLNKVCFVNSGSAASDLALRLAKQHNQRNAVYVIEDGYHGNTQHGIDLSHYKYAGKGGNGNTDWVHALPLPKLFGSQKNSLQYIHEAKNIILDNHEKGITPACLIAEPISGCGGQVPMVQGYLKEIFKLIRELGSVCVIDEVQTGFGRLGNWFWGFEYQEVIPDIVILGKAIGNGHPIGAVITTEEICQSFETGMEFFSSFGGNPVSCAVGLEVLNVLEDEKLPENVANVGAHWKESLFALKEEFDLIGDVRGEGLFLGIEIMDGQKPGTQIAHQIKNHMRNRFILCSTDGRDNNVIKVKPPLCFSHENVDEFCDNFKGILTAIKVK